MNFKKIALATGLVVGLSMAAPVFAADCSVVLEGNDSMQYNLKEINVSKTCKEFTIDLHHVGKLPKGAMGHNVIISKKDDAQAIATEGLAAGLDKDYVKADDPRIFAHTKLIGGGESAKVTFPVSKLEAGQTYEFFCSYPGHFVMMKGALNLVD